jgi:small conductance mechanosensitive channel
VTRALAVAPVTDIVDWLRGPGLEIVLLVLGAMLLARFAGWVGRRVTRRMDAADDEDALVRSEAAKHRQAVAQVLTWVVIVVVWSIAVVLVLERIGVPATSLVASAAVVGAAVGFGAQSVVRDLIAGFFIIVERQYGFGDVVHISAVGFADGATGTIEEVALRTTRLRRTDGAVVVVPNGLIVQTTNLSREWARAVVDVPLPAGVDVLEANELLRRVGAEAYEDEELRPLLLKEPAVMGTESLEVGHVELRMVARTLPGRQFEVARELRTRVAVTLQQAGIAAPPGMVVEPDPGAG